MKNIITVILIGFLLSGCSTVNRMFESPEQEKAREFTSAQKRQIDIFNTNCQAELKKLNDISTDSLDLFFETTISEYKSKGIYIKNPVKTNNILVSEINTEYSKVLQKTNKFLVENKKATDKNCYQAAFNSSIYTSCEIDLSTSDCYIELKNKKEKISSLVSELTQPIKESEKNIFSKTYGKLNTNFTYCYEAAGGCNFYPTKGQIYYVSGTVKQVMPGGLRMLLSGETFDGYISNLIMLYVKKTKNVVTGEFVGGYYAKYIGPYTYTTVLNASNTVHLFEEITIPRKNGKFLFYPQKRCLTDTELNSLSTSGKWEGDNICTEIR